MQSRAGPPFAPRRFSYIYFSGGQYELLDTHITNSRLILNHPAKGMYNAVQIFKMKSPGSSIISE